MKVYITGASGRLGRILRAAWSDSGKLGFDPIWCCRQPKNRTDARWDILSDPMPAISRGAVIIHLAGIVRGDEFALAANSQMALKVCDVARLAGAAHVFLASSAAVYGVGLTDHVEVQAPAPVSDYGRAKLTVERDALCWAHKIGRSAPGISCLRIGNVLGADALFGGNRQMRKVVLDAVAGQSGGPRRSYIGPREFANVLAGLVQMVATGVTLPRVLNNAAAGTVAMGDLLAAADQPYCLGQSDADVIPRVGLSTKRLSGLMPVHPANVNSLWADFKSLKEFAL